MQVKMENLREQNNSLLQLFTSEKQKYLRIYIGSGAIVMKDRCIPVYSISSVYLDESKAPLWIQTIIVLIISLIFFAIGEYATIIGSIGIIAASIMAALSLIRYLVKLFFVRIHLNSGQLISFGCKNKEFTENALNAFCRCLDNPAICMMIDFETQEISEEKKANSVSEIRQIVNNYYGNYYKNIGFMGNDNYIGKDFSFRSNEMPPQGNQGERKGNDLTEAEWEEVERYFWLCS